MTEFLKYISPIAILTSIWGIFQFYEKRKYERDEKRRTEKIIVIKNFHSILNNLKVNLINFQLEAEIIFNLLTDKAIEFNRLSKDFNKVNNNEKFEALKAESQTLSNSSSDLKEKSEIEFKKLSEFLKDSLLEINNVNLLNIIVDKKLNEGINNLTDEIKNILVQVRTNKRKIPFNESINGINKKIYWVEKLMVNEIK
tara:strand:- start:92 stop:685 length:594 start_codon:yes stop_codon:yes gene_type:complete